MKIKESTMWQSKSVNFWTDKWLHEPVVELMNTLLQKAKVSDFISNKTWQIPVEIPGNIIH